MRLRENHPPIGSQRLRVADLETKIPAGVVLDHFESHVQLLVSNLEEKIQDQVDLETPAGRKFLEALDEHLEDLAVEVLENALLEAVDRN